MHVHMLCFQVHMHGAAQWLTFSLNSSARIFSCSWIACFASLRCCFSTTSWFSGRARNSLKLASYTFHKTLAPLFVNEQQEGWWRAGGGMRTASRGVRGLLHSPSYLAALAAHHSPGLLRAKGGIRAATAKHGAAGLLGLDEKTRSTEGHRRSLKILATDLI